MFHPPAILFYMSKQKPRTAEVRRRGLFRNFKIPNFRTFGLGWRKFDTPGFKSVGRRHLRPGAIRPNTVQRSHGFAAILFLNVDAEISARGNKVYRHLRPTDFKLGVSHFGTPHTPQTPQFWKFEIPKIIPGSQLPLGEISASTWEYHIAERAPYYSVNVVCPSS